MYDVRTRVGGNVLVDDDDDGGSGGGRGDDSFCDGLPAAVAFADFAEPAILHS